MPKKTLLQIVTHHRQNPLDFSFFHVRDLTYVSECYRK
jgi:hypothetical protein